MKRNRTEDVECSRVRRDEAVYNSGISRTESYPFKKGWNARDEEVQKLRSALEDSCICRLLGAEIKCTGCRILEETK